MKTRKALGLSRSELAARVGIKRDQLRIIETRTQNTCRADYAERLCEALGIDELPLLEKPSTVDLWWVPRTAAHATSQVVLSKKDRKTLRHHRREKNISQHEVAHVLGIATPTYNLLETLGESERPVCPDLFAKAVSVLQLPATRANRRMMKRLGFRFAGPGDQFEPYGSEIAWEAVPLGKKSDGDLARELRCDIRAVFRARTQRGIPAFEGEKRSPHLSVAYTAKELETELGAPPLKNGNIDWTRVPLGCTRDSEIAQWIGCSRAAVKYARQARGVPTWVPVRWDKVPLGELPDTQIAEWLLVSVAAVRAQRVSRGIPAAPRSLRREGDTAFEKPLPPPGMLTPRALRFPSF